MGNEEIGVLVLEIVLLLAFAVLSTATGIFVDEEVAINALHDEGYANITIVEKDWFLVSLRGCGSEDSAMFKATALNSRDENVTVYVCSGWIFKGATIRHK